MLSSWKFGSKVYGSSQVIRACWSLWLPVCRKKRGICCHERKQWDVRDHANVQLHRQIASWISFWPQLGLSYNSKADYQKIFGLPLLRHTWSYQRSTGQEDCQLDKFVTSASISVIFHKPIIRVGQNLSQHLWSFFFWNIDDSRSWQTMELVRTFRFPLAHDCTSCISKSLLHSTSAACRPTFSSNTHANAKNAFLCVTMKAEVTDFERCRILFSKTDWNLCSIWWTKHVCAIPNKRSPFHWWFIVPRSKGFTRPPPKYKKGRQSKVFSCRHSSDNFIKELPQVVWI